MRPCDFWRFVTDSSFGKEFNVDDVQNKLTVNWFMPPVSANSGGHINIFRFLGGLEERNFECRVVIVRDGTNEPASDVSTTFENINDWYGAFNGSVHASGDDVPPAVISFATGWQTAYSVKRFRGSPLKCYFVQDYEPLFYAASSEATFAEQTYSFGFVGITAGNWLSNMLASKYSMNTRALGFSYNKSLYKQSLREDGSRLHLFVYVRPETPRRGWEIALLALWEIHRKRPDIHFILAGGYVDPSSLPFPAFAPGSLRQSELPSLYSQCDAALVISLSNLSLLPLELMACGVAVISNKGPNVEWLLNNDNAILADNNPGDIAAKTLSFFSLSREERNAKSAHGQRYARATDWDREIDKLARFLREATNPTIEKRDYVPITPRVLPQSTTAGFRLRPKDQIEQTKVGIDLEIS